MEFKFTDCGIEIHNATNFDLSQTFDCGQCFRWNNSSGKYTGVVLGKRVSLSKTGINKILIEGVSCKEFETYFADYFDLNTDYESISESFMGIHPILSAAVAECRGIRILKQDPWETLCSFIISQNNNIPRIKKIINALCNEFGESLSEGDYSFPSAQRLASLEPEDLAPIKAGFRAKYIIDAARKVSSGTINFQEIEKMPPEMVQEKLMQISGVGPKVASCVRLYGLHDLSAFPLDVWMKKVMEKFFKSQSPDVFGNYAGVAQQYLYHYSRSHPEVFD